MNILHIVPSFYPATAFGGPIHSTYGLCNAIARQKNVSLRVLTSDTSGDTRHDHLRPEAIRESLFPGYQVDFRRKWAMTSVAPGFITELPQLLHWADVVHLTAVYSFPTLPTLAACRAMKKPVVWTPRGALQRWEHTKKQNLKLAWERSCQMLLSGLPHSIHVTAQEEGESVRQRMPRSPIVVIPNGVDIPQTLTPRQYQPNGVTRILYLGRLDPIKALENVIDAVGLTKTGNIELTLCGSGDADYTASLARRINDQGLSSKVKLAGFVEGAAKTNAFEHADVCILASFSENFGMTVVEALAHAVPVIASRGTPWKELETKDCGVWVSNDPASLAQAMDEIAQKTLAAMGQRGRAWMQDSFDWNAVASRMIDVYRQLMAG